MPFLWFPQPLLVLKAPSARAAEETAIIGRMSSGFWQNFRAFYDQAVANGASRRFAGMPFYQDISRGLDTFAGAAYVDTVHYAPAAQAAIAALMAPAVIAAAHHAPADGRMRTK